jgi:hypothetical protein
MLYFCCVSDHFLLKNACGIPLLLDSQLQFYLKEIYDSNKFNKQDMLTWEQSSVIIKTNFDQTKAYFEKIVKATNIYKQNTGGNSA